MATEAMLRAILYVIGKRRNWSSAFSSEKSLKFVIDSTPENEYQEVLTKARAIFGALNADINDLPK